MLCVTEIVCSLRDEILAGDNCGLRFGSQHFWRLRGRLLCCPLVKEHSDRFRTEQARDSHGVASLANNDAMAFKEAFLHNYNHSSDRYDEIG